MPPKLHPDWPVLRTYDADHLARIALPLGGVGTGTVSLGGRGDLRDWEIMNRPAKGFAPSVSHGKHSPFFAVRTQVGEDAPEARLLEGPLDLSTYEASHGSLASNHGLPRFREATFAAAYPLGQVTLRDKSMPIDARIEAFNPMIPGDADASGIPVAVMRFTLTNRKRRPVSCTVAGVMPNFIGNDGSQQKAGWGGDPETVGAKQNVNRYREPGGGSGVRGIEMVSEGVAKEAEQWGTMALTVPGRDVRQGDQVSHRTAWINRTWGDSALDFWDDLLDDGALDERDRDGVDMPVATLALKAELSAGASRTFTFFITWHFPNRMTWTPRAPEQATVNINTSGDAAEQGEQGGEDGGCCDPSTGCCPPTDPNRIGNYYTTRWRDAWHVAQDVAERLPALEEKTVAFVRAFCDADLPLAVREAALFNAANIRSQTCFRTEDGRFYGFEGCHDSLGCCLGSCTHVWNYEQAVPYLFGELARTMREVEFAQATNEVGRMSFRVYLPIERAQESPYAAADGQMGCLMKLYREWKLSGDERMLRDLWPGAKRALSFCWVEGGWDADQDGVMEGCQHNTMDVEYYGPNPQMQGWYLGALRSAEEMAKHAGDDAFAKRCRELFDAGSRWMDEHLFNGEYYEHEIRPIPLDQPIAEGLKTRMGAEDSSNPILQLGAGCLVDQLVGQFMAHVIGLGYLHDPGHVKKTLKAIMKYNFKEDFHDHFNHMRSFVLGGESALLMASYPRGNRPEQPFPYYNEVMTGFEYTAAVGMLYEGQHKAAMKAIEAIRDRYDGRKRSPFNEAECGHHYARAMASWGAVLALTGFQYDAAAGVMTFAQPDEDVQWFWSTGDAWGTARIRPGKKGTKVDLEVLHGSVRVGRIAIAGVGEAAAEPAGDQPAGSRLSLRVAGK